MRITMTLPVLAVALVASPLAHAQRASLADRVAVLYAGRLAEIGPVKDVILNAEHPYTRGLLNCLPRIGGPRQPLPALDRTGDWAE